MVGPSRTLKATGPVEPFVIVIDDDVLLRDALANDAVAGLNTNIPGATGGRPTVLGKISV